jgi:riboflavin kinase/FMN adenylyltransferase
LPDRDTIVGPVVHGDKRGRQLGFPTANVEIEGADIEFGVYAAKVDGRPAAVSVGVRPTFGEGLRPLAEAHLLDFDGDLYGRTIRIELLERVRGELAFEGVDALVAQIHDDVRVVRSILG